MKKLVAVISWVLIVALALARLPQRPTEYKAEMHRVYDNTRHKILPSEGCFYKVVVC